MFGWTLVAALALVSGSRLAARAAVVLVAGVAEVVVIFV
jgi:hypothetical protein